MLRNFLTTGGVFWDERLLSFSAVGWSEWTNARMHQARQMNLTPRRVFPTLGLH